MNIHENTALLDAFVDGELTSEEMIFVQSHLDRAAGGAILLARRAGDPGVLPHGGRCGAAGRFCGNGDEGCGGNASVPA